MFLKQQMQAYHVCVGAWLPLNAQDHLDYLSEIFEKMKDQEREREPERERERESGTLQTNTGMAQDEVPKIEADMPAKQTIIKAKIDLYSHVQSRFLDAPKRRTERPPASAYTPMTSFDQILESYTHGSSNSVSAMLSSIGSQTGSSVGTSLNMTKHPNKNNNNDDDGDDGDQHNPDILTGRFVSLQTRPTPPGRLCPASRASAGRVVFAGVHPASLRVPPDR